MNELPSGIKMNSGRVAAIARVTRVGGRLIVVAGMTWLAWDAAAKLWSLTQGRSGPIQRRVAAAEDPHDALLPQIAGSEARWGFQGAEGVLHQANLSRAELDRRWEELATRKGELALGHGPCSTTGHMRLWPGFRQGKLSLLEKDSPTGRVRLAFLPDTGRVVSIAIATPTPRDRWRLLYVSDEESKTQTSREPLLPFPEPVHIVLERAEPSMPPSLQVIETTTGDEAVLRHWRAMGWECAVSFDEPGELMDVRLSRDSTRPRAAKIGSVPGNYWLLMRGDR